MKTFVNEQNPINGEPCETRPAGGRFAHWLAVAAVATLVAAALPAAASAADYCVAPNTGCGGTNVATFQEALDKADDATDADRIFLGAGDYTAPSATGFSYDRSDAPVEIAGQGAGQTTLTSPGGSNRVLRLIGGAGSSVHDLTISLPQNAAAGLTGLTTDAVARRIEVVEHATQANLRRGVDLMNGGALEDSSVTLGIAQYTTAVLFDTGGGAVRRSALSAQVAVNSGHGGTIERSRLTASSTGVDASRGATAVAGSVIRVTGAGGAGVYAGPQAGAHPTVSADGVTIVGPSLPNTRGVSVGTHVFPAESADINLTNTIIRGFSTPLRAATPPAGAGQAKIAASYSDYDPSGIITIGANALITETNVSNLGEARFVDAAGGDYRLLPGSPLLDTGDPATAQGLDLDGNPLVADGDGDGIVQRDLGAFELQPVAGTGGQPPVGGQPPIGDQPPIVGPPALDTRAPLVSRFRAAPSVFAVARARPQLAARLARGTSFRYALSEPARVTLKIQRALSGRRTRYRTIGALSRSAKGGANVVRFSGRLGNRALRPGHHRAVITATDAAGNRSAPRTARFRVAGT